jgi:hypothetical protein
MKFLGIPGIEESSVYRGRFNIGRAKAAEEILLWLGRDRLGEPDEGIRAEIQSLRDHDVLNLLIDRLSEVASWDELLSASAAVGEGAGRLATAREVLLMLGRKRFGEPSGLVQLEIDGTTEIDRLRAGLDRIQDVQSWDEVFPASAD